MTPTMERMIARTFTDALLIGMGRGPQSRERQASVEKYVGRSLLDLGGILLEAEVGREGVLDEPGGTGRVMASPAFRELTDTFMSKAIAAEFNAGVITAAAWCKPRRIEKFTEVSWPIRVCGLATLPETGSAGEPARAMTEQPELTRTAKQRSARLVVSRQMLASTTNGWLYDLVAGAGAAARAAVDDVVYDELTMNAGLGATCDDGEQLFSTAHAESNYMTGSTSALGMSSLSTAMGLLRAIQSRGGAKLNQLAQYLIVPPELEVDALQVRQAIGLGPGAAATETGESTTGRIHNGPLSVIVESRLSNATNGTTAWYLASAKPAQGIELITLGHDRPTPLVMPVKTDNLALEWVVVVDVGVATVDWRGIIRSRGA
jgi:hypothetical protein